MDKYKKLAGNTAAFAVGSFGAKFLSFFLTRLYTGVMTEAEYGQADLIYLTVNLLYPVVTFAMADAVIRFGISKTYGKKNVYSAAIFSTVIGMTLLALCSPFFNIIENYKSYGFLLYIYCYCSGFRQIAASFVRAKGYVRLFALDGILSTLTIVVFNCIFLLGFKLGVNGYILSIIISDALSFLGLTFIASLHKYLDIKHVSKRLLKDMLKYSLPLIPTYILWWITAASDRFFIFYMIGKDETGVYTLANKIPTLLMLVTTLFYQAWQMSAIENKDDKGLGKFYGRIFSAYSSFIFIAAAGLILIVKPFTRILASSDGDFFEAYHYTPVLILAMIFQCLCQFLSSVYNVKKKSLNSLLTAFAAAAVNLLLNYLLIPAYGIYGAAMATAAAYLACYVIRVFDARSYLRFKVAHGRIIINFIVVLYMAYVAAVPEPPKFAAAQLTVLFILVALFNFEAVLSTVKKVIKAK